MEKSPNLRNTLNAMVQALPILESSAASLSQASRNRIGEGGGGEPEIFVGLELTRCAPSTNEEPLSDTLFRSLRFCA